MVKFENWNAIWTEIVERPWKQKPMHNSSEKRKVISICFQKTKQWKHASHTFHENSIFGDISFDWLTNLYGQSRLYQIKIAFYWPMTTTTGAIRKIVMHILLRKDNGQQFPYIDFYLIQAPSNEKKSEAKWGNNCMYYTIAIQL